MHYLSFNLNISQSFSSRHIEEYGGDDIGRDAQWQSCPACGGFATHMDEYISVLLDDKALQA